MARSITSPFVNKTRRNATSKIRPNGKVRSSLADELFKGRIGTSGTMKPPLKSKSATLNQPPPRVTTKLATHNRRGREDEDYDGDADVSLTNSRYLRLFDAETEKEGHVPQSSSESGESDEEDEEDWVDGSTLIAPYHEEDPETEEDRALALVEYLQVPMQEKSNTLKQDLCNALIAAANDVRQSQDKVERQVDADRGKGIVHFNDACDKRHVDTTYAHAQLKESAADNQAEMEKLFVQLKQAYGRRNQLWVDLKARITEITDQQAASLEQLDENLARTIAALDKKSKTMLKDDSSKDKEKLLRGVLGKM